MGKNSIKIEISEGSLKFLQELANEIETQDNRMTARPYYYVIQEPVQHAVPYGHGGVAHYIYDGDCYTAEELLDLFDEYVLVEHVLENIPNIEKVYIQEEYEDTENSNIFFTEKGYKDHLKLNRHNLKKPRSYVKHAFRNPEIDKLIKVVLEIGKQNDQS